MMKAVLISLVLLVFAPMVIADTYLGEFSAGEKFDEFRMEPYGVGLVYRGAYGDGALLVFILSSPDNPIVPGGYVVVPAQNETKPLRICTGEVFNDVTVESVGGGFCGFIEDFFDIGLTAGCTDSLFCPDEPVSRAQMAVFLMGMLDLFTPPSSYQETIVGREYNFIRDTVTGKVRIWKAEEGVTW
jgi:hypothetical protein